MISVNCENLSLSFGAETVLENVSFALNEGDKLGIIGVNGAGKSSLFAMITGKYQPTSGEVFISKGKTVGILEQNIEYDSSRTILDEAINTFSDLLETEKELENLRAVSERTGSEADAKRYADCQESFTSGGGYEFRGRGYAKALVSELIGMAKRDPATHVIVSVITGGNDASVSLHRHFGFTFCGTIHEAGFKFGRYLGIDNYELIVG